MNRFILHSLGDEDDDDDIGGIPTPSWAKRPTPPSRKTVSAPGLGAAPIPKMFQTPMLNSGPSLPVEAPEGPPDSPPWVLWLVIFAAGAAAYHFLFKGENTDRGSLGREGFRRNLGHCGCDDESE